MHTISFKKFADTKNKVRFNETDTTGEFLPKDKPGVIGALYVGKTQAKDMPEELVVLVDAGALLEELQNISLHVEDDESNDAQKIGRIQDALGEIALLLADK